MLRRYTRAIALLLVVTFTALSYFTFSARVGELQSSHGFRWPAFKSPFSQAPSNSDVTSTEDVTTDDEEGDVDTSAIEPIAANERVDLSVDWEKSEGGQYRNRSSKKTKYNELFAISTANKKYFNLTFGRQESLNPSIIPHPDGSQTDTWVMVAEMRRSKVSNSVWHAQLICDAKFKNGALQCMEDPTILPLASTRTKHCEDDYSYFALNVGPHGGRIFYGPDAPMVIYGSNSEYACFGLWMQDLRMLADWGLPVFDQDNYRFATELQKPGKRQQIEQNWLIFWDSTNEMYVQYQTTPFRAYAKLNSDGSTGRDLGYKTREHDMQCMRTYLPETSSPYDSMQQSANTLSVTLCKRHDQNCVVKGDNTLLMTILQHTSYQDGQPTYESYVYLFQRDKPFKLHGIGKKPLWINGRGTYHDSKSSDDADGTASRPEWFHISGMSWKDHGQTYIGYVDDVLYLTFDIEGERSAAIDVRAGDLLGDIGLCYSRYLDNPLAGPESN